LKKKTTAKLLDECAALLQKIVRLKARDKDGYVKCVSCETTGHYKEMQGGHFIERKWTATRILEENIHPQCPSCNGGFGGKPKGNLRMYTLYMIDMYGKEWVEELEILKHKTKKYTRDELEEIKKDFKRQIKELE